LLKVNKDNGLMWVWTPWPFKKTSPLVNYHMFARDIAVGCWFLVNYPTSAHAIVLNLYPQKIPLILNTKNDGDMVFWHLGRYFIFSHVSQVLFHIPSQQHHILQWKPMAQQHIYHLCDFQLSGNHFSILGFKPWKTTPSLML
jgi:hypothetical protein